MVQLVIIILPTFLIDVVRTTIIVKNELKLVLTTTI
jgi:hypothetical protein